MSSIPVAGALRVVLISFILLLVASPAAAQTGQSERSVRPDSSADVARADARSERTPDVSVPTSSDLPLLRLDELLEDVRDNNTSLHAARLEAEALSTRPAQVSSLPDPMLMATYQPYPVLTARGAQRSQWRVEQQIPYPGKLGLQGDIAGLSADVAHYEAVTFEEDLITQAKQAYFELYRIQEQTGLVENFQDRLLAFEEVATTQYEVGTGMQQAILKAQLEKNALSQRLVDLETRRRTAVETLARLVNRPLEGDFEVRVDEPAFLAAQEDRLLAIAMETRPEVAALAAAEERAEKQIALARKQFLPDFGLNLTYFDMSASDAMATTTGRDALAIGLSVKVPIQRGRLHAQVEEANVRAAQVTSRQEALTTDLTTQIADFVSRLHRESEQLDLYRDLLIPQAESTLEATLSAYTTNRTDFLDLLDAERMLFTLQMGYEDAMTRYLKASAGLERALGVSSLTELDPTQRPRLDER